MKTTIQLNDSLVMRVKKLADEKHTTLTALMEEGLRYILVSWKCKVPTKKPVKLKTINGGGIRKGINLDDNASVRDILDGLA